MPRKVIDSHVHLWDPGRFRYSWHDEVPDLSRPFLTADFDAAAEGVDVAAMVFLEADIDTAHRYDEAAWVGELAEEEPRIAAIVAAAALERGDRAREELERLKQLPLVRGIRRIYQAEPDLDFCLQPSFIEGVRALAAFDFSFDICMNWRYMDQTIRFAERCDNVPLILDHIGKPNIREGVLDPWRHQMRHLARLPHVVCKLSGVATEADHANWTTADLRPFMLEAVEAFGFDRIVFGGDWPVATLAIGYGEWVSVLEEVLADATDDEMDRLFRRNAAAFYRIDMSAERT